MLVLAVVVIVGAALVAGAAWGAWFEIPDLVEGLLLATASGALVTSVAFELVEPAVDEAGVGVAMVALAAGAVVFTGVDYLIDEVWHGEDGFGIMAAVTLDGVPENLALGVALIGASAGDVAALAAAIMLSNLPEAAGASNDLSDEGWSAARNIGMWAAVAVVLGLATVIGRLTLAGVSDAWLGGIESFAAGAVLASLATEVVPDAFRKASHAAGVAITAGFVMTFLLTA